ncbi:unnamed protein product [Haemonchus placei]|uniref:NfeD domain-containing protein n=1 Tax=Haemonchus placei TaxID=6290 RepID=A0A0N4WTP3_HAEPC|nr:unnamed protein product [Haemonchus placei]
MMAYASLRYSLLSEAEQTRQPVNLLEWLGTRVLARVSGDAYQPGSIKNVHDNRDVVVQVGMMEVKSLEI